MQRISILSVGLAICTWAGTGWAADPGYGVKRAGWFPTAGMTASYAAPVQAGGCASCGAAGQTYEYTDGGTSCGCGGCNDCGDPSGCGRARCHGCRKGEAASFNCQCRGSYKYPVPPQYTYFWPGMYSQRTMSEYNSPYRFPPLKSPEAAVLQDQTEPEAPLPGMVPFVPEAPGTSPLAPATTFETTPGRLEPGKLPGLDAANVLPRSPLPSQRLKQRYNIP